MRGALGEFDWQLALEIYGHECAFCGTRDDLCADHAIPLARGGTNHQWNIRPLCKRCNRRKLTFLDCELPESVTGPRRVRSPVFTGGMLI
ncbi:MAG: HNH endonuclease signature motif containing protein [Planctomycetota bacterium]